METNPYSYLFLRGLTFREALNAPQMRSIHVIFFIITMIFVWQPTPVVITLLIGYWMFDFAVVFGCWYRENRSRSPGSRPPFRNPSQG